MVFHVFFEGVGHSLVEAKFGIFCGNKQICSHDRGDTRCVVTSFISFYLYVLQALCGMVCLTTSFMMAHAAAPCLKHIPTARIIKNYHILSRDLQVLITVSSVAAGHV